MCDNLSSLSLVLQIWYVEEEEEEEKCSSLATEIEAF